MKKFAALLCAALLMPLCACEEGSCFVAVSFRECAAVPFTAELYGADGWSLGSAALKEGENAFPAEAFPCYLQCALPEEYDCPVVYAEGPSVALSVAPAEYSEDENAYLHKYTAFLLGADPAVRYLLQLCKDAEEGGFCKFADFESGSAELALSDGEYSLEVFGGGDVVYETAVTLSASSLRFCVIDLREEASRENT